MKNNMTIKFTSLFIVALFILNGCAGFQTFNHLARSNDTVAVAAGWMQTLSRNTIRVTITDNAGAGTQTIYNAGDPNIRAVINLYPDPLSNIVVSRETGVDLSPYANIYSDQVSVNYTDWDKDWWQTTVFINLPDSMALGDANILIESIDSTTGLPVETSSATVEIVDGIGEPSSFVSRAPWDGPFPLTSDHLQALERSSHYQIDFSGSEIPAAISLEITHNSGSAFIANPTSEIKNIHWTDDGTMAKVLILPTRSSGFTRLVDLKFYFSGVDGVDISSFQAFDQNGIEIFTVSPNTPTKR